MRTILFMLMLLAASTVNAQSKLTIVVDGIEKIDGKILVAVYDSANFLKKPAYVNLAKVESEEVTIVLQDVAAGEYAVSVFHDENNNNRLDTGSFGIPIEKTGFSNNAKGKMGTPPFSECKFTVDDDTVI
ncbi:MAG: DUF2141 domain-containing protein, partial [Prevotellaceae bacterium]|nr:DUF2141 domain-containing protein [Prevotellaceae bacterium]